MTLKLRWLNRTTTVTSTHNVGSRKYPEMRTETTEEVERILQYTTNADADTPVWHDVDEEYDYRERTVQ